MDIQIRVKVGRKVVTDAGVEKWYEFKELVVEGSDELSSIVQSIISYKGNQLKEQVNDALREEGIEMPKGTKVDKMYQALKKEGMDEGKAARIAQAKTGQALATGKPPMGKKGGK